MRLHFFFFSLWQMTRVLFYSADCGDWARCRLQIRHSRVAERCEFNEQVSWDSIAAAAEDDQKTRMPSKTLQVHEIPLRMAFNWRHWRSEVLEFFIFLKIHISINPMGRLSKSRLVKTVCLVTHGGLWHSKAIQKKRRLSFD